MAVYNKFNAFVSDVLKGVHNFTSDSTCTVTVALSPESNAPLATNSVLADITQISYTNLSSRIITGVTANQVSGTATLTSNDLVLSASGTVAAFRYLILYNADPVSPANPLIGWYDYGSNLVLSTGDSLTIDFTVGFATLT